MAFRIRSILVGSDSSDAAGEVLRTAIAFASLTGSELHVIYAAEDTPMVETQKNDPVEEAAERLRERVRRAIPREETLTSLRVLRGPAHDVILRRAQEVAADLIVIGAHRKAEGGGHELGTTADNIVRSSEQPCLVVRGPVMLPLRSVLVPTDLSDAAKGALDLALNWASALRFPSGREERTRLDILHVLTDQTASATAEQELQEEVDAAQERTGSSPQLEVNPTVVEAASVPDEILARAKDARVDLVVMGTHGNSAMSRSRIGSVSSEVARRTDGALLLAPPGWWQLRQARETILNGGSTESV